MAGVCLVSVCHVILSQMFLSKMSSLNIAALMQEREIISVFCITLHLLQLQPVFLSSKCTRSGVRQIFRAYRNRANGIMKTDVQ